ncbi:nitric-oxide synthase [Capsaspora owczarzaki ATCC 30864]|uniref:Nitric-oxide synthase n=1 Tax=Capsaspora owczarzaki (strain ATCC 30864) TaxID=595528 RepID=A0A0D2VZB3_CAPO3|nr:nitric-oxide synthase [Capsaspora owczarzaki ATCC 30864]KJE97142.1 nitric-oxide synthase [Capsaspora owczarzaki ATCC 30864]|eukprot:XP_004343475.2 nitric-oxide synthase [Capsaspora owczarzaki ATCC 30864]
MHRSPLTVISAIAAQPQQPASLGAAAASAALRGLAALPAYAPIHAGRSSVAATTAVTARCSSSSSSTRAPFPPRPSHTAADEPALAVPVPTHDATMSSSSAPSSSALATAELEPPRGEQRPDDATLLRMAAFATERRKSTIAEEAARRYHVDRDLLDMVQTPVSPARARRTAEAMAAPPIPVHELEAFVHERQCPGCGTAFQLRNEMQLGYVSPAAIEERLKARQIKGTPPGPNNNKKRKAQPRSSKLPATDGATSSPLSLSLEEQAAILHASPEEAERLLGNALRRSNGDDTAPAAPADTTADASEGQPSPQPRVQIVTSARVASPSDLICKRCHQLTHNNQLLPVQIDPAHFQEQLAPIRSKEAFIVHVVDVTTFPCSSLPNLEEYVGSNQRIFFVGSKADLLPGYDKHLSRIRQWLSRLIINHYSPAVRSHIVGVHLVSGMKGTGCWTLLDAIQRLRGGRDVYVVGCANVGKSTLVNNLLDKLRVLNESRSPVTSITTSGVPGTTIGLLGFPLLSLSSYAGRLDRAESSRRVEQLRLAARGAMDAIHATERAVAMLQDSNSTGGLGRSHSHTAQGLQSRDAAAVDKDAVPLSRLDRRSILRDVADEELQRSGYLFDTPGIMSPHQSLHRLSAADISAVIPTKLIVPQVFRLNPGQCVFIGGLGRLDVLSSADGAVLVTVFVSNTVKLHATRISNAEDFYQRHLGTPLLSPPFFNESELAARRQARKSDSGVDESSTPVSVSGEITEQQTPSPSGAPATETQATPAAPRRAAVKQILNRVAHGKALTDEQITILRNSGLPFDESLVVRKQQSVAPADRTSRPAPLGALSGRAFSFHGAGIRQSVMDVVFSDVGFASLAAPDMAKVEIKAHTPGGVGIFLRPSLMPDAVNVHGHRGIGGQSSQLARRRWSSHK